MSAIENGAPAPQFKSINCTLWYNTRVHSATRCVRLLVPVLPKPCSIIVFGIQLVRWKRHNRVGIRKYLTEYYFLHGVHTFYHVLLGCFFVVCLIPSLAVNLYAAHNKTDSRAAHKALLACFLLSCITQIITQMQRMKNSLHAVHESWLVCSLFRLTRVLFDSRHSKNWRTHACSSHVSVNLVVSCTVYTVYIAIH